MPIIINPINRQQQSGYAAPNLVQIALEGGFLPGANISGLAYAEQLLNPRTLDTIGEAGDILSKLQDKNFLLNAGFIVIGSVLFIVVVASFVRK